MNNIVKTHLLIHLFAIAHVLVVIAAYMLGIKDEILLTCLTILMIVLICNVYKYPLDLAAVMALLFCFAGFFMGTKGVELISSTMSNLHEIAPNAISTLCITELIGWCTWFITSRHKPNEQETSK